VDVGRSDTLVEEGLPSSVLEHASDLVRCDVLSFVEFDDKRKILYFDQSFPVEAAEDGDELDAFWNNYWDDPSCFYPSVSGDTRTITTVSDFYTSREMHETGMYVEYLGPLGLEHEAMVCLSAPAGRSRRLLFFRERGSPDFDNRDRLLLSLQKASSQRALPGARVAAAAPARSDAETMGIDAPRRGWTQQRRDR
jgi:hypothetical protein